MNTKWTIREMLCGMFFVAMVAAWYWNSQHGQRAFNLWTTIVIGVVVAPVLFYQFALRRKIIFLIAGILVVWIVARHGWLIANL